MISRYTIVYDWNLVTQFIETFAISSQAPPFVMSKKDANSTPNTSQDFEGLSIDILEEMKKKLKFNYRIYVVPDEKFGVRDRNTLKWNGIVAEIINKVFLQKKNLQTSKCFSMSIICFSETMYLFLKPINQNYSSRNIQMISDWKYLTHEKRQFIIP